MPLHYTNEPRDVANHILARFVDEPAYCQIFSENAERLEDILRTGWWLEVIAFSYSGYDRASIVESALPLARKMGGAVNLAVRLCREAPAFERLHPGLQLRDGSHSPIWLVLHDGEVAGLYQGPMTQQMLMTFLGRIPELSRTVQSLSQDCAGFRAGLKKVMRWCGILPDPDWWFRETRFSRSIDKLGAIYSERERMQKQQLIE